MGSILTDHVRAFPLSLTNDWVLREIARLLRGRLRRTGLIAQPPALLGYSGASSWLDREVWDELVADGYMFAIADRIEGLKRALTPDHDIDPLVIQNVNRFLAERQRDHNPIGYAAYQNVRAALKQAAWCRVERLAGRPISDSRVHLGGDGTCPLTVEVPAAVARAMSSCSLEAQAWLLGRLETLRGGGSFRLGDLVRLMEDAARAAWATKAPPASETAPEFDDDGRLSSVPVVWPADVAADRDAHAALVAAVRRELADGPQSPEIRERRVRVFDAMVLHADQSQGAPPLQVEMAEQLGLHQVTLSRDLAAIRDALARHRINR